MITDPQQPIPLRQHVQNTISRYLQDMGNTAPENLYQMLLAEIEPPLIEEILKLDKPTEGPRVKNSLFDRPPN